MLLKRVLTCSAHGAVEGCPRAVTHVAVAVLHTPPSIMAEAVTAAVSWAAGIHARGHFSPLIKVKGHSVYAEGTQASKETPLSCRGSP